MFNFFKMFTTKWKNNLLQNIVFIRWWVIICSVVLCVSVLQYKGLFTALWYADNSRISFFVLGVFAIVSGFVGYLTFKISHEQYQYIKFLPACWFAAETLMGLGMIGTLIGFMLMMGPALEGIDPQNVAAGKEAIIQMAKGMSVAITTTLTGLSCSLLLKLQLINLETLLDNNNE